MQHGKVVIDVDYDAFPKTRWGRFQKWRAIKAAKRRNPTLKYYEAIAEQHAEAKQMELLSEDQNRIKNRRKLLEKEVMQKRQEAFYARVKEQVGGCVVCVVVGFLVGNTRDAHGGGFGGSC